MKLIDIIWKEISLVKSQKIALLLIILYPLLVVGILGPAFSGTDFSKMTLDIGLLNHLQFDSEIVENFSSFNNVNIKEFYDVNELKNAIKQKEVVVGIQLVGDSPTKPIKVDFVYDNSSLFSSKFFVEISKAMVQRVSAEMVQNQLNTIWKTINGLGKNIDKELANVNEFKNKLSEASNEIDGLETKLNSVNFSEVQNTLDSQQENVDSFNKKNEEFKQLFSSFKSSFSELKTEYSSLKNKLNNYQSRLEEIPKLISFEQNFIEEVLAKLELIESFVTTQEGKEKIIEVKSSLENQKNRLNELESSINLLIDLSNSLNQSSSKLSEGINKADDLFKLLENESSNVSTALGSSSGAIGSFKDKLSFYEESTNEVKKLITESRKSKNEIEQKLDESDSLLSDFSKKLVEFKDITPELLAKPVLFYEVGLFEVDPLGILVANSIVVVLILTCSLLTSLLIILEKNQKVYLRLTLSVTSKAKLIIGKILGQLGIAIVEGLIILSVAFLKIDLPFNLFGVTQLGFGLALNTSLIELGVGLILVSLAFISIGIGISFFTKNQSTAILSCLLLVVPMLFLSGIILPLEFMDPTMQIISSLLPLTVANNLLLGLIVKGTPLIEMLFEVIYLITLTLIATIIIILQKD